jgi:hypothetical protein
MLNSFVKKFPNLTELSYFNTDLNLVEYLEYFNIFPFAQTHSISRNCPKLQKIKVKSCTNFTFLRHSDKVPTKIEEFSISNSKIVIDIATAPFGISPAFFDSIFARFSFPSKKFAMSPHMEERGFNILPTLKNLPESLTEISLDYFWEISDPVVEFLISKWGKNLTSLSLKGTNKISQKCLKYFPGNFPVLKELNVSWYHTKAISV